MSIKVLIIDHDTAERDRVRTALDQEGFDAAAVQDLDAGLTAFRERRCDVLVISGDSGSEPLADWWSRARGAVADTPIIFIGPAPDEVPCASAVTAPVDTGELAAQVRAHAVSENPTALTWLPEALRAESDDVGAMEAMLGWAAPPVETERDVATPSDPVSLGIFTADEAGHSSTSELDDTVVTESTASPSSTGLEDGVNHDRAASFAETPPPDGLDTPHFPSAPVAVDDMASDDPGITPEPAYGSGADATEYPVMAQLDTGPVSTDVPATHGATGEESLADLSVADLSRADGTERVTPTVPPRVSSSVSPIDPFAASTADAPDTELGNEHGADSGADTGVELGIAPTDRLESEYTEDGVHTPTVSPEAVPSSPSAEERGADRVFASAFTPATPELEVTEPSRASDTLSAIPLDTSVTAADADPVAPADVRLDDPAPSVTSASVSPPPSVAPITTEPAEPAPTHIAGVSRARVEELVTEVARKAVERVVWETVPAQVQQILSNKQAERDKVFNHIVERAVWEILPQIAAAKVSEEINRLGGGTGSGDGDRDP